MAIDGGAADAEVCDKLPERGEDVEEELARLSFPTGQTGELSDPESGASSG